VLQQHQQHQQLLQQQMQQVRAGFMSDPSPKADVHECALRVRIQFSDTANCSLVRCDASPTVQSPYNDRQHSIQQGSLSRKFVAQQSSSADKSLLSSPESGPLLQLLFVLHAQQMMLTWQYPGSSSYGSLAISHAPAMLMTEIQRWWPTSECYFFNVLLQ